MGLKEALHENCAVLNHHVKELVGCLAALIVRGCSLLFIGAGANLLLNDDCFAVRALSLGLIVGSEEEFFEDLTDKVFLLDNSVTHCCVSLGNDLACESDQTTQELFLLFGELECLKFITIITSVISGSLLFEPLLGLDLVNDLVKEFFRVVDRTGIVRSVAQ